MTSRLSPEALAKRAELDANDPAKAAWRGERPLFDSRFGARTLGSLAEVQVGCEVYTDTERRRTAHDQALGGIVTEIVDTRRVDDDGEITLTRGFRCYDPVAEWRKAFVTLAEADVDPDGVEGMSPSRVTAAIRRFCVVLTSRSGMLLPSEMRLIADILALSKALYGGAS